jgi:hypothetical protein
MRIKMRGERRRAIEARSPRERRVVLRPGAARVIAD